MANKMITNPYLNAYKIDRQAKGKVILGMQMEVAARKMEDLARAHGNKNMGITKRTPSARRVSSSWQF
jgi:hypothetical protein